MVDPAGIAPGCAHVGAVAPSGARADGVLVMQAVNTLPASPARRQKLMQAHFADSSRPFVRRHSLMSPHGQRDMIDRFAAPSAAFCAKRGPARGLDAWRAEACRAKQVSSGPGLLVVRPLDKAPGKA